MSLETGQIVQPNSGGRHKAPQISNSKSDSDKAELTGAPVYLETVGYNPRGGPISPKTALERQIAFKAALEIDPGVGRWSLRAFQVNSYFKYCALSNTNLSSSFCGCISCAVDRSTRHFTQSWDLAQNL